MFWTARHTLQIRGNSDADAGLPCLLIQFGANPQGDDFSPLGVATWIRANDVTQALVEHGADVNVVDIYGNRPLLDAAADKYSPSGLLLLAHGADPNIRRAGSRRTPLMEAAGNGNTALVRALLEKRVDLTLKDVRGKTALDFAREYRREKIVSLLTQAGAK